MADKTTTLQQIVQKIGLTRRHKTVLVLYLVEGLSQTQISKKLRCSQARVSQLFTEACNLIQAAGLEPPTRAKAPRVCFYPISSLESSIGFDGQRWQINKIRMED